jgi:hypothetical protein
MTTTRRQILRHGRRAAWRFPALLAVGLAAWTAAGLPARATTQATGAPAAAGGDAATTSQSAPTAPTATTATTAAGATAPAAAGDQQGAPAPPSTSGQGASPSNLPTASAAPTTPATPPTDTAQPTGPTGPATPTAPPGGSADQTTSPPQGTSAAPTDTPPTTPTTTPPSAKNSKKGKAKAKDAAKTATKPVKPPPPPPKPPVVNKAMDYLKPLAGSWTCVGRTYGPGPEHPTAGTMTFNWQVEGFWMQVLYAEPKGVVTNPVPVTWLALWGFDDLQAGISSFSVDNIGGSATQLAPDWKNPKLVFEGPGHRFTTQFVDRDIYTLHGDSQLLHTQEANVNDNWIKLHDDTCTRTTPQ